MRMKKACEATALTERAIRLYLAKDLILPKRTNGILDFSSDDIQQLKDIALLRQFDFSIEEIANMLFQPENIQHVISKRMECARLEEVHSSMVFSVLSEMNRGKVCNLHDVAAFIREQSAGRPTPNFGRFDEISREERQSEERIALAQLDVADQITRMKRRVIIIAGIVVAMVVAIVLYLAQPRVQGFLSFKPFTIISLNREFITVSIDNDRIREVIQHNQITVPYRAHGVPLVVGQTIDSGCQLAINISNYDLLRIGINPLQTIRTRSEEVNREWMRLVVRSLFDNAYQDNATLWIREYNPAQYRQLFLWEE